MDTLENSSSWFDHILNENSESNVLSIQWIICFTLLYIAFLVFGAIGNLIICIVITIRKAMHTAINYYIFSLAVSDLFLLVITIPVNYQELWGINGFSPTSVAGLLYNLTTEIAYEASILTVTALSVERYMAVCHPLRKQTMSNLYVTRVTLIVIWVTSAVVSSCFVLINFEEDDYRILIHLSSTIFFVAPVSVILYLYLAIAITLMKRSLAHNPTGDIRAIKLAGKIFSNKYFLY